MILKQAQRSLPLLRRVGVKRRKMVGVKAIKLNAFHKPDGKLLQQALYLALAITKLRLDDRQAAPMIDRVQRVRLAISTHHHRVISGRQRDEIAQQIEIQERHVAADYQHRFASQRLEGRRYAAERPLIGPAVRVNGDIGGQRRPFRRPDDGNIQRHRAQQPNRAPQQWLSLDEQRRLIAAHAPTLPSRQHRTAYLLCHHCSARSFLLWRNIL